MDSKIDWLGNGPDSQSQYKYTIKEVGESGFSIEFDGKKFIVSYKGDMEQGVVVTNKQVPEEPETPPDVPDKPNKPEKPNVLGRTIKHT